jgi:DNA-binding transcriptional MerR regulator
MSAVKKEWLSAAQCAARTGLTVRALRVYEREELLAPVRSANGWRRYGPADLTRLNAIISLKALGLTLAQIRTVVAENPPSLPRILAVQAQAWKAKLAAAQRALTLTEAACRRLEVCQELSLDELCELIKSSDNERSSTMADAAAVMRELINERITPEEERAWVTWWAQHPDDAAKEKALRADVLSLLKEVQVLAESGADPGSPEAQQLVDRHRAMLLKHDVAERRVRLLEWNAALTKKWLTFEAEARYRDLIGSLGFSRGALEFLRDARRASPAEHEQVLLIGAAKALLDSGADPASSTADEVVQRLTRLCESYELGDAYVYARWAPRAALGNGLEPSEPRHEEEWDFLARALHARANAG